MNARLGNGVRRRVDQLGDPWANQHREELGAAYHMQDLDAMMAIQVMAANTGERFFLEYVPDAWANRLKAVREFALVALFDRKRTEAVALGHGSLVSRQFYLWLARLHAGVQARPPKFFYVIGADSPPWTLLELDITTGQECGRHVLHGANWPQVWEAAGLVELRRQLQRWLLKR